MLSATRGPAAMLSSPNDDSLKARVLADGTMEEFRHSLQGELILPGDGGYEAARRVWNGPSAPNLNLPDH